MPADSEFTGPIGLSDVPTWYEVRGTTLVQVVVHNDAFTHPIVADPYTGAGDFYMRGPPRRPEAPR